MISNLHKAALAAILGILLLSGGFVPAQAGGNVESAACRAIQWLDRQQKADGGFGFTTQTSPAVTADVTYALALFGEDLAGPRWTTSAGENPLDALAAVATVPPEQGRPSWVQADPGQAGRLARAVALAGGNPRNFGGVDLVQLIQEFYDPATGLYHPNFLFRHALAVEGLLRSGVTPPQGAYDALLDAQLDDGGWFWALGGTESDVDTTGRVLQIISGVAQVQAPDAYARAAGWLAEIQLPEGDWNTGATPGPANSNSTALAVGGLLAAGYDPQAAPYLKESVSALDALLAFQEPSGAFIYIDLPGQEEVRVMATADALTALAPLVSGGPVCKSIYLPVLLAH